MPLRSSKQLFVAIIDASIVTVHGQIFGDDALVFKNVSPTGSDLVLCFRDVEGLRLLLDALRDIYDNHPRGSSPHGEPHTLTQRGNK